MDFALADSVLHLNDGKSGHAGTSIFSQMRLDVAGTLLTFIIGQTTPTGYVSALKKNTEKQKNI